MANAGTSPVEIVQYYQTKNPCYISGRRITPSGIVVHSTGANNPNLKRYVGPDDGILGVNKNGNHWNKSTATKCVHAFIGKVADGSLKIYQTLPWDYRCWGVGSGENGSYNSSHIQFEICEDGLTNETYYREAFALAARLCAYLCQEYGIKPANVVGHYEAAAAGYASNHADPRNWQKKFGGSMDSFRDQVTALMNGESITADVITSGEKEDAPAKAPESAQASTSKPETTTQAQGGVEMPTIRKGMQGTAVRVLQRMLLANGCTLPRYGADGDAGAETIAAVKAFQTAHKLTADGVAGPLTWAALAG